MTSEGVDKLRSSLTQVLGDIYTSMPSVQLILAEVIGGAQVSSAPDALRDQRIRQPNADIIRVVFHQPQAVGCDILLVDMYDAVPRTAACYADGVHPIAAGYTKRAEQGFGAILPVPSIPLPAGDAAAFPSLRRRQCRVARRTPAQLA